MIRKKELKKKSHNTLFPAPVLGIDALPDMFRVLSVGSVWWLNTADQNDAISILNQTIIHQLDSTMMAIVASEENIDNRIKYLESSGPKNISLYSIDNAEINLVEIAKDLMRFVPSKGYFFIILCPSNFIDSVGQQQIIDTLRELSAWSSRMGCTILLISNKEGIRQEYPALVHTHNYIGGMALLTKSHEYSLPFWFNNNVIHTDQHFKVTQNVTGWQVIEHSNRVIHPFEDKHLVICHSDVLEGVPFQSKNWMICKTNELVFATACAAKVATVIFCFSQYVDFSGLLESVYQLRTQPGSDLKIIIREKNRKLRKIDIQILINCGVAMIIPDEVTLVHVLNMINSIAGMQFNHVISDDLSSILEKFSTKNTKGYQVKEAFIASVSELLSNPLLPVDQKGTLVILRPVHMLTAVQAVAICQIRRMGDIITHAHNQVILFLASCHVHDVDMVLQRLFSLDYSEIFSHSKMWHTDVDIANQLVRLAGDRPVELSECVSVSAKPTSSVLQAEPKPVSHIAVPFTLLSDLPSEGSHQ